jgi:hypothetical protein
MRHGGRTGVAPDRRFQRIGLRGASERAKSGSNGGREERTSVFHLFVREPVAVCRNLLLLIKNHCFSTKIIVFDGNLITCVPDKKKIAAGLSQKPLAACSSLRA